MYGNNDFRDYKADGMGGYHISHYGKKGMKWHKHLKAATNWWDTNVTGASARGEMKTALATYKDTKTKAIDAENKHRTALASRELISKVPGAKSNADDYKAVASFNNARAAEANKNYHSAKERYDKSAASKVGKKAATAKRKVSRALHQIFKKKKRKPVMIKSQATIDRGTSIVRKNRTHSSGQMRIPTATANQGVKYINKMR